VFINDWKVVGPELFLGIAVQLLVVLGVWYGSRPPYSVLVRPIKALSLLTTGLTLWLIARSDIYGTVWNESFSFNENARTIHMWILVGCLVSLALANNKTVYENSLFMLFSALGMIGLAASQDFLAFYLTLELQSFCFYILAATRRTSQYSTESGLKYFILGAIASGFLLFGGSLLYGATGSLCFSDWMLLSQVETPMFFTLGMVFFFVGLLFKLSAFPFHVWTPDVYEGAPTFITAFFALVPKIAVLGLFFKLLSTSFYSSLELWQPILVTAAVGSMLIGALGALGQQRLKRLFAYSTIAHVGFILLGLATCAWDTSFFYLALYFVMTIATFSFLLSFGYRNVSELAGVGRTNPALGISFALLLFSMAGVPPLAGFFGKYKVFEAAVSAQMYSVALVAVVTSVIGGVYYLRIIKTMFFAKVEDVASPVTSPMATYLFSASVGFLVFFWLYPAPVYFFAEMLSLS
jgi:NADH-quinone oxidoreductase subunit N